MPQLIRIARRQASMGLEIIGLPVNLLVFVNSRDLSDGKFNMVYAGTI